MLYSASALAPWHPGHAEDAFGSWSAELPFSTHTSEGRGPLALPWSSWFGAPGRLPHTWTLGTGTAFLVLLGWREQDGSSRPRMRPVVQPHTGWTGPAKPAGAMSWPRGSWKGPGRGAELACRARWAGDVSSFQPSPREAGPYVSVPLSETKCAESLRGQANTSGLPWQELENHRNRRFKNLERFTGGKAEKEWKMIEFTFL